MSSADQPSLTRRLLAGGSYVLAGKLFTGASTLAIGALLTRLLSADDLGVYGLALSVATVGAMLAQLGLHQAVVRLISESVGTDRPGRARAAVRFVYLYCAAGVLVVVAFLALGGGAWIARRLWDAPALAAAALAVAAWAGLTAFQILTSETFRGFQQLHLATLFGGVITGVLTVAGLLALLGLGVQTTLDRAIAISVGATAVSLLLGLGVLRRRVASLESGPALPRREVFSIALPLWANGVTALFLMQFDIWILGAFVAKSDVGVYWAAVRLVNLVSMSLLLVNLVAPPFIAELYARGERRRLERVLRNTATLAGIPALVVLLAFVFFGAPILALIYGEPYRAGATVLTLLSLGKLANVWTGSCGVTMSMTGHQTVLMRITIFSSALAVGGALVAVRPFGMIGVAASMAAGAVVQNVALWLGTRRYTGMWTHAAIPRPEELKALLERGFRNRR